MTSASIAARKAASVLPDPVGAASSACEPLRIAGQACACTGVGSPRSLRNQRATAGWKAERGMGPKHSAELAGYTVSPAAGHGSSPASARRSSSASDSPGAAAFRQGHDDPLLSSARDRKLLRAARSTSCGACASCGDRGRRSPADLRGAHARSARMAACSPTSDSIRATASRRRSSVRPRRSACTSPACAPASFYVPINPALTPIEVGYYLTDATPRVVVSGSLAHSARGKSLSR